MAHITTELTAEKIAHLKHLLDMREKELRENLHHETTQQDDYVDVATEAPDSGDSSFANLSVDLGNAAVTRDIAELRAIEGARTRIENDTYGICVNCEAEIPAGRMEVQPTAERCAPCQEMYEKTHIDVIRHPTL